MPVITSNINNSFFTGSYKEAWRKTIPDGLSEAEVDFIIDTGKLKEGNRVLDLMCGYGRHSLELGKRNIHVTAIDNLSDYINEIREKAEGSQLPVEAICSDILNIKLEGKYHAALCMGNSFAFFPKDDALSILKNISNHLLPGGILIINSWMIAEIALKYFRERDWHYAGDFKCILDYKFCLSPSRIESEQTILGRDGLTEVIQGIDYIYSLNEMEEMFRIAGLQTRDLFSTPRKRKFTFGDTRIYIVAEKLHG